MIAHHYCVNNVESESVPLAASLLSSKDVGGATCYSHEISQ